MRSIWAEVVLDGLDEALDLLGGVVENCPDDLWRTPMWRVQPCDVAGEIFDDDGTAITDSGQREARIQRWSQPWSVAWHALEVLDYDLAGDLVPWAPPPPFADHPHWRAFSRLVSPWSRPQISDYVAYCRERVRNVVGGLSESDARVLLPATHRYAGQAHASIILSLIGHATAHAIQIRQFIEASRSDRDPGA